MNESALTENNPSHACLNSRKKDIGGAVSVLRS